VLRGCETHHTSKWGYPSPDAAAFDGERERKAAGVLRKENLAGALGYEELRVTKVTGEGVR
jgi:hypothetical protein